MSVAVANSTAVATGAEARVAAAVTTATRGRAAIAVFLGVRGDFRRFLVGQQLEVARFFIFFRLVIILVLVLLFAVKLLVHQNG